MSDTKELPLYLTYQNLKKLIGWPFGRTHTQRLMDDEEYADRRFPKARKLGPHRNSPPMWYTPDVLEYLKRHGLPTPDR